MTFLVECQLTGSAVWKPIGIVSARSTLTGSEVLDYVRVNYPAICSRPIRARKFTRIPGVFNTTDNLATGQILVIE